MCITEVTAWQFAGKTYPTESLAISAAVSEIVGNEAMAKAVLEKAEKLIPLLQRHFEIEDARPKAVAAGGSATEGTSEKSQGEPMDHHDKCGSHRGFACDCAKMVSRSILDAGRHTTGCKARATGFLADCNCDRNSKL